MSRGKSPKRFYFRIFFSPTGFSSIESLFDLTRSQVRLFVMLSGCKNADIWAKNLWQFSQCPKLMAKPATLFLLLLLSYRWPAAKETIRNEERERESIRNAFVCQLLERERERERAEGAFRVMHSGLTCIVRWS